jgi:hypothetical protein
MSTNGPNKLAFATGFTGLVKADTSADAAFVAAQISARPDGFDRLRLAAGLFRSRYRMLQLQHDAPEVIRRVHGINLP